MKRLLTNALLCIIALIAINTSTFAQGNREYYEWRYYSIADDGEDQLDKFLEKVLIPAYERQGVATGVFEIATELLNAKQLSAQDGRAKQRIVLFVYNNIDSYLKCKDAIWEDTKFTKAAQSYFDKWATKPAYSNMESYLCVAFDKLPRINMPDKSDSVFELRRYRSANEEAGQRKIEMFNKDEMAIFDKVDINQVCYGEVLAGAEMPSLIYLTSYKNDKKRLAAWEDFRDNKTWKKISKDKEYLNTVRSATVEVIRRVSYSKFY